jgi:hypothetical protein
MFAIIMVIAGMGSRASAQHMVQIGIGGGVAIPAGTFHDTHSAKENALITLTAGPQYSWLGTRLDYSYNEFSGKNVLGKQYHGMHLNVLTGDLVASFPLGLSVKPYLIGGAGWYHYQEASDVKSRSDPGITGGVGCTFPFLSYAGFIEVRYHRIYGRTVAQQLVPVSFGIVF